MEEGDHFVEQSVEAEVQGEAPALQNVSGSATPAPQFPTQFAQQMAAFLTNGGKSATSSSDASTCSTTIALDSTI